MTRLVGDESSGRENVPAIAAGCVSTKQSYVANLAFKDFTQPRWQLEMITLSYQICLSDIKCWLRQNIGIGLRFGISVVHY